ncbi:MAG: acylphosphatase [Candidatus Latescibacterota bacterium]|nr:MAG: acylphosphatase [Candidatus Latescibacterota bacterium]
MSRLHVWVEGLVHGVFFRDTTRQVARGLNLSGWVKNLPDHRVEAVFQGDRESCERILEFVRKGPPSARVDHVEFQWEDDEEDLNGFQIRF